MLFHSLWSPVPRSSRPIDEVPHLIEDVKDVHITIYVAFVGFTILIWDHLITFADELEYIWQGSRGLLVYLYLLNRYTTPFIFVLNLFAYLSPTWTPEPDRTNSCQRFVRYEGATTIIGINITMFMMLIRVSALYQKNPLVVGFLSLCLCIEFGVQIWLLTHGVPVLHDRSIHTCSMVFDSSVGIWASSTAFLPLIYDTIILIFTLNKTLGAVRKKTAGRIVKLLLRDGILYYSVIFSVTLVLTVMIVTAPPGIQNVAAQLEYLLTVAMGSRIMLHLRKQGRKGHLHGSISGMDTMDTSSTISSTIRLRTIHTTHQQSRMDGIVREETSVVHDDRGQVVEPPSASGSVRKNGRVGDPDWHELAQSTPQAVRLTEEQKRDVRDSGFSSC